MPAEAMPTLSTPALSLSRAPSIAVRLARGADDLRAVQRLRYEVFNLHEGLGLADASATGLDADRHDPYCDHLMVEEVASGRTVGTYRLLPSSHVPSFGYYSEGEFDLSRIKASGLRLLELGRSCVAPDQRAGRVIDLLFRGIGEYVRQHASEALMGCVSVHGGDLEEIRRIWHGLRRRNVLAGADLAVEPRPGLAFRGLDDAPDCTPDDVESLLPPLFRAYLRLGARICGPPAYDAEFGTTDFLVLLDLTRLDGAYARRFMR